MASQEFSVPARDLDAAGKAFRFTLRAAWIRGAVEGTDVSATDHDGLVDIRLSKSGNDVVLRGALTGELVVPCARCLEPARVAIQEPLSALFVPASSLREGRGADDEGAGSDADVVPYDGETVVLDGLVRDELLLALPIVPLCSEGCAGIRHEVPAPGAAPTSSPSSPSSPERAPAVPASIDPRLLPLLLLKNKT